MYVLKHALGTHHLLCRKHSTAQSWLLGGRPSLHVLDTSTVHEILRGERCQEEAWMSMYFTELLLGLLFLFTALLATYKHSILLQRLRLMYLQVKFTGLQQIE